MGAIFAVAAGSVNGGLVDFFHGVQVAVMLALMTNVTQFAWWKCKAKKVDGHWDKFGPVYLLMLATVLVLVQPTCMLVIGSWGLNNFFFDYDDDAATSKVGASLVPNTLIGWMIQIFGTYVGFIIMFTGVVWSTNLHKKIAKKWARIRRGQKPRASAQGGANITQ